MSATLTAPKTELKTELALKISGEILESNLPAYAAEIKEFIASLPKSLETDEDFANAKKNVKALQTVEGAVKMAEENTLSQAKEIYETLTELKSIGELGRQTRLELSKLIKEEDQRKKDDILAAALALLTEPIRTAEARILDAMKGKKTLPTLQAAAEKESLEINAEIVAIDAIIAQFDESLHRGRGELLLKSPDAVLAEMEGRKQAQEAAIREAKLKEETAKLKAEADAKAKEEAAKNEEASQPESAPVPAHKDPFLQGRKLDAIPVKSPEKEQLNQPLTETEEMTAFCDFLKATFGNVREERLFLLHQSNFDLAEEFAASVSEAWKTLNTKIKQR